MTTAAYARPTAGEPSLWRTAARQLIPVPPRYRRPELGPAAAAKLLGCPEKALAGLAGTPFATPAGDGTLLFDYYDIMNLGLLSGTGRSLAELAERQCMRFAAEPPERWLEPRRWRLRLEVSCSCREQVTLPRPEVPAPGVIEAWEESTSDGVTVVDAVIQTAGIAGQAGTSLLHELYDGMLARFRSGQYRFAWLPQELRADIGAALANRTLDCVVASVLLCRQAVAAGLEARTRNGFLLGLVGVEHAWMEVREDGRWLPADPLPAFLAGRSVRAHPDFAAFCLGSFSNRLLAWDRPASAPLAPHECAAGGRPSVSCRQLPQHAGIQRSCGGPAGTKGDQTV